MTKEELEKEAEDNKPPYAYCALDTKCELWKDGFKKGAEPREKQIQIDAEQIRALQKQNGELTDELKTLRESMKDYGAGCYENGLKNGKRKLEAQIEKLIDFVISKTECCDVCPITDTCINSEGTCPYAGILAKGEEEVTKEWLMQFISKEIRKMTEEEYFRKNYPDSCYGDKPLSPHWDFFQDGVEFGERQSEKRIAELEELIEKYRQAVDKCLHITFMGCGCEVNTIGQYATLVDGYLTGVEGLAKWKN